jgi:L-fuconate dehydratase
VLPTEAGYSAEMHESSLEEFAFPNGSYWAGSRVLSTVDVD